MYLIYEWNGSAPMKLKFGEEVLSIIKSQVVHWRRVELMSWNTFFDDVQAEQENLALVHWPELLLGALTAASNEDAQKLAAVQTDFRQQFKQFLFEGECGQFAIKRDMLRAIGELVLESHYPQARQVAGILYDLFCSTADFNAQVAQYIEQNQKELRSKFTNQVRLFQWDERNFDALRIDTRKSHRLVLEILRKFNEVFQQKTVSIVKENKQSSLVLSLS